MMNKIVRHGLIGILKEDKIEEYEKLHQKVWPEILLLIKDCHLNNYSIFREGTMVFSYYEYDGDNYEADMKKMEDNSRNKEWWSHTCPCFEQFRVRQDTEYDVEMKEIFYLK